MSESRGTDQIFGGKSPYTDGTEFRPAMMPSMLWRDIGSSGLRQYSGWIREEFLRALQGREAARAFREMRDNDSTVGALMFAIHQTMRRIEWREEAGSDDSDKDGSAKYTDFAHSLRYDMSATWEEFVTEALSMLEFGFSVHEIVYKRRDGHRKPAAYSADGRAISANPLNPLARPDMNAADVATSSYDDGLIGIRRLAPRSQDTILKWYFDPNGQVTGTQQQPWMGPLIDLPIEKMLLFRPMHYKENPEGRSILRNSYRPWFFKKRIEEEEAIMFERMNGLPVLYLPQDLLEAAAKAGPDQAQALVQLEQYRKIVTNVRIDEQMGVILPSNCYEGPNGPTNVRMYEFELLTPKSAAGHPDSDKILHRYSLDILKTAMADFIDLGHQARGTQNLAISKVDMFFQAISGWLFSMASVLNRYMLPRVWDLNAFPRSSLVHYVPDLAQRIDIDSIGNFILRLAQAGARLFPDEDLENYLRDAAGMPSLDDEAAYQPLQDLLSPASQDALRAQAYMSEPGQLPSGVRPSGAGGGPGSAPGGKTLPRGTPTGGAGSGGPLGKTLADGSRAVTAGSEVADAILFEVAKARRLARPPYRVQGPDAPVRKRPRKTVRAAA